MREAVLSMTFEEVAATGATIVAPTIFSQHHAFNGFIEQICVRAVSGGGANFAIQFRGDETSSNVEDLYVNLTGQSYDTLIDVNKPFDTARMTDSDLSIMLNPASAGTFTIRVDFRILGRHG